jgi:hypothetical protein
MVIRALILAVAIAGCAGNESAPGSAGDMASASDDMTRAVDLSDPIEPDMSDMAVAVADDMADSQAADMSKPADLLPPPPPDLAWYPTCGGPGLPNGSSCTANDQCCHGLCWSSNGMAPYLCCYAHGTNCQNGSDCCSGQCSSTNLTCL